MIGKLLCKLGKHKMLGPYPIGEPGEVRYICSRCYRLIVIIGTGAYIYSNAKEFDDPMVHIVDILKKYG